MVVISPLMNTNNTPAQSMDANSFEERRWSWAWWMLVVITAATTIAAFLMMSAQREAVATDDFSVRQSEVVSSIRARMEAYEQIFRGGIGFVDASTNVNRKEWHNYVSRLDIEKNYPGIQAMGYSIWVDPADRESHVGRIRAEGFPDYTLRPAGNRERLTSIIYIEPFDERNRQAFGYDMYSQETRQRAMRQAAETGNTIISGRVILVQEIDEDVQAGFLMYLPHYRGLPNNPTKQDRWEHSVSFVYGAFRMNDLMRGVVGSFEDIGLEIYDGPTISEDTLMYRSFDLNMLNKPFEDIARQTTQTINIKGVDWTVRIAAFDKFEHNHDDGAPLAVLGIGGLLTCLVAASVWAFQNTHQRAELMAREMVTSLSARTEALHKTNAELEEFAYRTSHDLRAPIRSSIGLAKMCRQALDDHDVDDAGETLQLIQKALKRLDGLIADIHEIIRADKAEETPTIVDFDSMLADVLDSLSNMPGFYKLDVRIGGEKGLLPHTLEERLRIILSNLVSNAVKYQSAERDLSFIEVKAWREGSAFMLSVSDNGIGIPAGGEKHLFAMFKRLHPRVSYGSGLGLYILKKSSDLIGGKVIYTPGNPGTCFTLELPGAFGES